MTQRGQFRATFDNSRPVRAVPLWAEPPPGEMALDQHRQRLRSHRLARGVSRCPNPEEATAVIAPMALYHARWAFCLALALLVPASPRLRPLRFNADRRLSSTQY